MQFWRGGFFVLIASILLFATIPSSVAQTTPGPLIPNSYIVVLNDDVSHPSDVANDMAHKHGLSVSHVYQNTIKGYSAIIHPSQLSKVSSDPRVSYIEQDGIVTINAKPPWAGGGDKDAPPPQPPQTTPTGIERIFSTGYVAGNLTKIKVAVIDTGIDETHPDLNVVDGINCAKGKPDKFNDDNGHGSHVAGTIGAIDNDIGVIGVAPGVALSSVKVLDRNGSGSYSGVICGVDWAADPKNQIDVANMSLGGGKNQALNDAVTEAIGKGVVFAIAAGNESTDACDRSPASTPLALTVSALDDRDGTESAGNDPLASFSNYGSCVDIAAPGVLIYSTWKDGGYDTISGTSMATPHVAGAAAVYLANNSGASTSDVASALTSNGNFNWIDTSSDGQQEPLLDVRFLETTP